MLWIITLFSFFQVDLIKVLKRSLKMTVTEDNSMVGKKTSGREVLKTVYIIWDKGKTWSKKNPGYKIRWKSKIHHFSKCTKKRGKRREIGDLAKYWKIVARNNYWEDWLSNEYLLFLVEQAVVTSG